MAAMEYQYGLQEIVVEVPFLDERGFGSFAQFDVVDTDHLHLPTAISQWSTTDPVIYPANDRAAWNSIRQRMQATTCSSSEGPVYDMCVPTSTSAQHGVNVSAQTNNNNCQQLILHDAPQQLPANSSNNNTHNSAETSNFPVVGEIYPWMHQMVLNHFMISHERSSNDQMPQLISEFSAQQPCLYTSSSECVQDADSSGSSGGRGYTVLSSGVTACSSDEINWRNSDITQGNFAASSTGFHMEELYDDSSSVAPSIGHVDISNTNPQSSSLSLVMQRNDASALIDRTPNVSWATSATESDNSVGEMTLNHCSTLDPLLNIAGFQDISGSLSTCQAPYKRPRLSYTSSTAAGLERNSCSMPDATTSSSRPLLSSSCSSLSGHRNLVGGRSYPMTSLNVADALYRDPRFSHRQQMSTSSLLQRNVSSSIVQDLSPRGVCGRYASRKSTTAYAALTDSDSSRTTSNRKHNATSIEPQSVAARHRRKKISERVRVLEKLIPGGSKMDTASMLDEAIEYVKFLQLQVGLLEKLGELPDSNNSSQQASPSSCLSPNAKTGASSSSIHGSPGVSPTVPPRPTTSPLILSEVLQQQLFKQKYCLVSLRQYPSGGSPSASFS